MTFKRKAIINKMTTLKSSEPIIINYLDDIEE